MGSPTGTIPAPHVRSIQRAANLPSSEEAQAVASVAEEWVVVDLVAEDTKKSHEKIPKAP